MSTKRPSGRPSLGEKAMLTPIAVRFPAPMRAELERIRAERLDAPDLSAIVRELVAEAIQARAKKAEK